MSAKIIYFVQSDRVNKINKNHEIRFRFKFETILCGVYMRNMYINYLF